MQNIFQGYEESEEQEKRSKNFFIELNIQSLKNMYYKAEKDLDEFKEKTL